MRQSQVNPQISLGFSDLLRESVPRQSPDIIMVGEVRDAETAGEPRCGRPTAGIWCSRRSTPRSPRRRCSRHAGWGCTRISCPPCLRGIVSQRLVRTLCPHCKVSFDLSIVPYTFDEVRPWLTPREEGKVLYASKGCTAVPDDGIRVADGGIRGAEGFAGDSRPGYWTASRSRRSATPPRRKKC